jgi:hypothetical protein
MSAPTAGSAGAKRKAQVPEDSPTTYTAVRTTGALRSTIHGPGPCESCWATVAREAVKALIPCLGPIFSNAQGPDSMIAHLRRVHLRETDSMITGKRVLTP